MNSNGRIGETMICSSVPTSRSRTTANAVSITTCTSVSVPMTPGMKNQRSSSPALNHGRSRSDKATDGATAPDCTGHAGAVSSAWNCATIWLM